MEPQPLVFSIVVTFNGMGWLDRCLGSLRSSSFPVNTIVIDNGSTDGSAERIQSAFPEVQLVRAGRNLGFGQANNVGLRMALERGAGHVFLLNQDAWVLPDTIGALVDVSGRYGSYGVLSPLHLNGAGDGLDRGFSHYIAPRHCNGLYPDALLEKPMAAIYPVDFVNAAAWLITRKCLETVGGFSPTFFHYGEDDNYAHRMHHHGHRLGVVPAARIHHDREERSVSIPSDVLWTRLALLSYSDPRSTEDPRRDARRLLRRTLGALLTLDLEAAAHNWHERRLLRALDLRAVRSNRERSLDPGPSFLESEVSRA